MEDLNQGIRRIAEELRVIQEQLRQAGLLTDENRRRLHRCNPARRLGSLLERVRLYFFLHQQTARLAPYRASRPPLQAPRPD